MTLLLYADRAKLTQVVTNLLNNAAKATKSGSVILDLEKDNNHAIVSIEDTGTGIDPMVKSKLFMKFVTSSSSGNGLELFISKSIVEAHGGKILVFNNTNSNGATFTFTLPLLDGGHTQNVEVQL